LADEQAERKLPFRASSGVMALLAAVGLAAISTPSGAERAVAVPHPSVDETPKQETSEAAIFAGGCFWGVQGVWA